MGSGSRRGGRSDQFKSAFGDMMTQNQDSGMAGPAKRGGLFGSGMGGEDFINVLTRAAALAQGDYGGAAQIGQLLGRDRRQLADDERELSLYDRKQQIEQKYAKPGAPYRTQDNAGNVWEQGPDGEFKPIFTDPNDKVYFNGSSMVKVPNTLRSGGSSAAPAVAPGAIEEGYRFKGGDPGDPASWEKVGGAAVPPRVPFPGRRSFPRLG